MLRVPTLVSITVPHRSTSPLRTMQFRSYSHLHCAVRHETLSLTRLSPSCCSVDLTCYFCASGTCNSVPPSPSGIVWPSISSSQALYSRLCVSAILMAPSDGSLPFHEQDPWDVPVGWWCVTAREVTPERSLPRRESGVLSLSAAFCAGLCKFVVCQVI